MHPIPVLGGFTLQTSEETDLGHGSQLRLVLLPFVAHSAQSPKKVPGLVLMLYK